jgi:hypothetical protein
MNDWFDAPLQWQRAWLDAQAKALDAGRHANAAGRALVEVQEASRRAAEANMAAWAAWGRLMGTGPW